MKKAGDNQLADVIRKVAAGGSGFDDAPAGHPEEDPLAGRLTERERTILELMTEGKTNREIAAQLFLAEKTVKNYVSNLLMKMGIKHRAGAAAYLARWLATQQPHFPPASWQQPSRH